MGNKTPAPRWLFALPVGLFCMVVLAAGLLLGGSRATAAVPGSEPEHTGTARPTGTHTWCWWGHNCTPMPTRTAMPTRTPMATRTPCQNCTPHPTWTHQQHPTWTPRPTRTSGTTIPTRTHQPFATWTPRPTMGTRTPWPTRTPYPHATRTHMPPVPTGSVTPRPTHTPRPMTLRPRIQFGHAAPGGTAHYNQALLNRFTQDTTVNLSGASLGDWDVTVDPEQLVAHPGVPNNIGIDVTVPVSPTHHFDLERTMAVSEGAQPYTVTAHIVTIVERQPFGDLSADHWADGPVQYLVGEGVLTGYSDGTFRPDNNVTRAQFAKMLVGATGWAIQTPTTPTFSDVPADHWAYGYIETAAVHGAIGGYADGTFGPSKDVTRAQVAKMVVAALGWSYTPEQVSYYDVDSSEWYYTYIGAMKAAEVMGGYSDGSFRPYASTTRAQVAKILTMSLFSDPNE